MKTILTVWLLLSITSCSNDFQRAEINTDNLSGYVDVGAPTGIYGDAILKVTRDSVIMVDMPVSRLTSSLNQVRDTTLEDLTGMAQVYNIELANKGELPEMAFVDSVIVQLTELGLVK